MKTGRKTCKIPYLICDWCIFKNSVDLIALMNSRSHQMTMKTHSCSCTRKANLSEIHMMISHTLFIEQQSHLNRNRLKIRDKASHFFPLITFLLHLSFMLLWTYQQAFHLFDWRHWFSSEWNGQKTLICAKKLRQLLASACATLQPGRHSGESCYMTSWLAVHG